MEDTLHFTLGGRRFVVDDLTLRQVRDIDIACRDPSKPVIDIAPEIIAIGIRRSEPSVAEAEKVLDLLGTRDELIAAAIAIVRYANTGKVTPKAAEEPAVG